MATVPVHKNDQSRNALAAALVERALAALPLGHPAREPMRELQRLYGATLAEVRELLERVPGSSLSQKAARIGINKGSVWALWHGKYLPGRTVMERLVEAAGGKDED